MVHSHSPHYFSPDFSGQNVFTPTVQLFTISRSPPLHKKLKFNPTLSSTHEFSYEFSREFYCNEFSDELYCNEFSYEFSREFYCNEFSDELYSNEFSDELNCKFVCGESSEERGGDESRESEDPGGGAAGGAVGGASSSPSVEEEEQHERGGGRRGRGRRGGESRHPVYRGVRKRHGNRWVSEIREPGKKSRIWLGTFPTPEMAARAYDTAAFNLKKPYAFLNFPESTSSLPLLPLSSTPKQIQEAAAAAAAAFEARSPPAGGGGLVPTPHLGESSSSSSAVPSAVSISIENIQQLTITVPTPPPPPPPSYFDEDLFFDMPNVLTDMAQGLMMSPPLLNHGSLNGNSHDYSIPEPSLWDP